MYRMFSTLVLCGMFADVTAGAQQTATGAFTGGTSAATNFAPIVPTGAFPLTNTAAAPIGAGGSAEFKRPDSLLLKTRGLTSGIFPVLAVRKSDGARVRVGMLSLQNPTRTPDRQANEDSRSDTVMHQAKNLQSRTELPLPPDLPATDIGQVIVAGTGGNDLLVGLVPPSKSKEPATPPLIR